MSTSNGHPLAQAPRGRGLLRLNMAAVLGRNRLDGGWWPRTRDLEIELADLVDNFPAASGRIVRARVCLADWDEAPRRVQMAGGDVEVDASPRDDTHMVHLLLSDLTVVSVLVVPPGFTEGQGAEALMAAATVGNAHSAADLLEEVTDSPDADPRDRWTDHGDSWWGTSALPPSFQTGR